MYQEQRLTWIRTYLSSHKTIKLEEICEMLGVSRDTARRDLVKLDERGDIIRVKGGAALPSSTPVLIDYTARQATEGKERIAQRAVSLIHDHYDLLIDTSSTCALMAKHMGHKTVNVLTNSIDLVDLLGKHTEIQAFLLPGKFNKKHRNLTGPRTIEMLNDFKVDQLFLGACGISGDGLTSPDEEEAFLKKKMISRARQVVLLADHTKFQREFLHKVCDLEDIDVIVTDLAPDDDMKEQMKDHDIELIIQEESEDIEWKPLK
ncbi:DeoR/GlpR family DNA-binding transcription regulator [Paenibacillus physcomitrellae]|uniref:HTH-type transcriptional repressor GlcR n=1 Tax=Paenibacillus physcomitrellae TaxID=1619311 RepID=A0ABQ1GSV1_9BACL|nr:DeoR/GlpR family DNA-binding transcription regulator [Paenibacillus physcomitrellae]GGA49784.1 HTH-type transcriptional repressor GlcR [Paenibacillus physcomitrellae]